MNSKKQETDWLATIQRHNRNVALNKSAQAQKEAAEAKKEIAKAVKEQALQTKLDREANARHLEIMEELARKEMESKEFTKQQQFKLFDVSSEVEELDKQTSVLARIIMFYEIKASFDSIELDAIEDLQYRKLYSQVKASLKKHEDILYGEYSIEMIKYLTFCKLKEQIEPYNDGRFIEDFEELHEVERMIAEIDKISTEVPELSLDTRTLQEGIVNFNTSVAKLKCFWSLLENNHIAETEQRRDLLFSYFGLNKRIISNKEWKNITPISFSSEDLEPFCRYCFEFVQKNQSYTKTVLEIIENIDAPEAELTIHKIKEEQEKRQENQKQQVMKKNIKEKTSECEGCGTASVIFIVGAIVLYFLIF